MSGNRRDRSRSPSRMNLSRRRENKNMPESRNKENSSDMTTNSNLMTQQMLMANMYAQGNVLMGGMYPNMMMPSAMMGPGMMATTGMDMMSGSNLDMMSQASMDMTSMGGQTIASMGGQTMTPMVGQTMSSMGGQTMASLGGQTITSANAATMDMSMMGGMMMDPTMMGSMGMYSNNGDNITFGQDKKELVLKHCKLTPPESGSDDPPRRSKPPGCRTIFVCGLPDNVRESIVKEIFENFGSINSLRLSTKNFCHIRFDKENSVDAAMAISGYHLKLIGRDYDDDSKSNSGWLHVDYALEPPYKSRMKLIGCNSEVARKSRDDQNDYERMQRQVQRVQEVQMQQLTAQQHALASQNISSYRRSPSPLRVQPFSNAAMLQLSEKIKNEDHFSNSLPTLLSWLERGECSKKNATQFYSMIQATNAHIRRLFNEKMQAEDEFQECKERIRNNIQKLIDQLEQVAKVLSAATHQRVWDHFTKPQRKNIETWQKMSQEFTVLKEEFNEKFNNDDNEYSNGYNSSRSIDIIGNEDVKKLKLENESLKFQLEAYKNEVDVIKADAAKEMEKFKAQFIARQALQEALNKNPPLPSPVAKPPPPPPLPDDLDLKVNLKEIADIACGEAKLIGVMSAFLQVHPQGASLDYVVSYVRALFPHVSQATVHHVLQKHVEVFQRTTSGVGANIEHRWSFVAFLTQDTP